MRLTIAEINTTPGDFKGNQKAILEGIQKAKEAKSDMVVFPELAIPGYLTQDLMYDPRYMSANFDVLCEICQACRDYDGYAVVGHLDYSRAGVGKRFSNSASVIHRGTVVARYDKQLLPFYDVFHEGRYFEPGKNACILEICGRKVGILICEDVWNDKGDFTYTYANNPIAKYRELGVTTIISLNSSPWIQGKALQRVKMLGKAIEGSIKEIVYVNQCGGQDDLVFDGRSFVVVREPGCEHAALRHITKDSFHNTYDHVDLEYFQYEMRLSEAQKESQYFEQCCEPKLKDMLVLSTRDYLYKNGFTEAVFGSSGGVDSAVVGMILADAIQPQNVHGISMPTSISSEHSKTDAKQLHDSLGIYHYEVPIDYQACLKQYNENLAALLGSKKYNPVADENIQARLRDVVLMHASNAANIMPVATGNKTEAAVGYYTHFDMCLGFAPIKDIYKMQVIEIAKADPRIPANIWTKKPSAELAEGQTDEASLLPYPILDLIVKAYIESFVSEFDSFKNWLMLNNLWFDPGYHRQMSAYHNSELLNHPEWFSEVAKWSSQIKATQEYRRIIRLIMINEFKRWQTCVGPKVTPIAFGSGRRIPISKGWLS